MDSGNLQVLPVFVNKLRAPQIEKPPWDLISTLLYFLHLSNHLRKWFPLKLWDTEWKTHQDLMTVFQHTQHLLKESWLFQHLCNCANWKQIKKVEQEFVFFSYCHKPSIKVKLLIGRRGKEWRAMNEENWRIFKKKNTISQSYKIQLTEFHQGFYKNTQRINSRHKTQKWVVISKPEKTFH